jgi:prefoldin subunit 5
MILNFSVITYETPILNTRNNMKLEQIRIDGGTQMRAKMSDETVKSYADALKDGAIFPPVVVFFDGKDNWLADGFNRYFANKMIGRKEIDADVRRGNVLDAKLYACGANATHGQPRTIADKRNAVLMVLNESACKDWSARQVAVHCAVTHTLVNSIKKSLEAASTPDKPEKPERKTIPKEVAPEYSAEDDMREAISTLNEELEKANRAAAAGVLAEGMEDARAIMERQAEEIKTLQAELDGLKATRDTMMVEIKELKKQCAYYQKKMKELEK